MSILKITSSNPNVTGYANLTVNDFEFLIHFERCDNYEGEYGFDWMRDEYKTICEDYEKLKQEYTPVKLCGKEYFVPWLSMFQDHEKIRGKQVILKIYLELINGEYDKNVRITIDTKDLLICDKSEISLGEFTIDEKTGKRYTTISLRCDKVIHENSIIEIMYYQKIVGKLNVYINEPLKLNVKIVRLLGNEEHNTYNNTYRKMFTEEGAEKIKDFLSNHSLNQALIQPVFDEKIEDFEIDITDCKDVLEVYNNGIPRYKSGIVQYLKRKYDEKYGAFKGVICFLTPMMPSEGMESGHTLMVPQNHNTIIYAAWTDMSMPDIFPHEIGHALGLPHPFDRSENHGTNYEICMRNIESLDSYLNDLENISSSTVRIEGKVLNRAEVINDKTKERDEFKEKLKYYEIIINKYFFSQGSTSNFMDYNHDESKQPTYNNLDCFWKNQWDVMRKCIQYKG